MNDDHFDAPQLKGDFVTAIPFDNTMLPQVAGMWFGPDDYAVEVTHWINAQGPRSVTWATANGISVWIYQNTAKHFVGIGSLGLTEWEISGVRRTIQYIPMMGVEWEHQGRPMQPSQAKKYCYQIMDHLLDEATERKDTYPLVGLSVHPQNREAISLYEKTGFVWITNKSGFSRMALKLT